jgi:hypothetical protein
MGHWGIDYRSEIVNKALRARSTSKGITRLLISLYIDDVNEPH